MGPSLLLCADPAIGSDLVVHLGLGWAQPFIHMEDPLELPQGVGGGGEGMCVLFCIFCLTLPHQFAAFS